MSPPDRRALATSTLKRSPIFGDLPHEAIEHLAGSVRFEEFKSPTLLNAAGEPLTHLRYVIAGHLVHQPTSSAGEFVVSNTVGVEQWYSWLQVLSKSKGTEDLWSSADAAFLAFPSETVKSIALQNPHIYPRVLQAVHKRFMAAQNFIWQRGLGNDEKTLARLLLVYCAMGDRPGSIEVQASQQELGKLIGWPRRKVSEILRSLEAKTLLQLGYGTIAIPDPKELQVFVKREEPPSG